MRIDVWSDIACPWCYIGKRRLEAALDSFPHAEEVEVVYHSYQLDPSAPVPPVETATAYLARRYGGGPEQIAAMQERVSELASAEGLDYQLDATLHLNTRDAHRLLHLALETGGAVLQGRVKEALLEAYFVRAEDVTDPEVLVRVTGAAGLDAEAVRRVLAGDDYEQQVAADIDTARAYGATGVPFFVVDGRYGISGAQPTEVFARALERAWGERRPTLQHLGASSTDPGGTDSDENACGPEGCEVPTR